MRNMLAIALAGSLAIFTVACSNSGEPTNTITKPVTTNSPAANTGVAHKDAPKDDVPPAVHAAFPEAQSITTQHKDLTPAQIAAIEKETNTKLTDTDHHSYLAFSTGGGARKQLGAATVVEAGGKEIVIVYESRDGVPYIKEVRGEGMAIPFLDQFKGKGHDDKFQIGQDLKAQGIDEATARSVAEAVRRDAMTMQTLYGGSHSH